MDITGDGAMGRDPSRLLAPQRARAHVWAVEHAFRLLELIADSRGSATAADLATTSELTRATTQRLLDTLAHIGCVHVINSRHYTLGPKIVRIGESAGKQVGAATKPQLVGLARELNETVSLAVLSHDLILYVLQAPAQHALRTAIGAGQFVYAHASAAGKSILSQLDDTTVREITDRAGMPAQTQSTITDIPTLLAELTTIRRRGYASDNQEQEAGMRCYATSIPTRFIHAALSVSGPASRIDAEFAHRAIPLLKAAAGHIAEELASATRSGRQVPVPNRYHQRAR